MCGKRNFLYTLLKQEIACGEMHLSFLHLACYHASDQLRQISITVYIRTRAPA